MAGSVLVVCTGNICRSPMAEALLRTTLPRRIAVSSAGIRGLAGEPMDARSVGALEAAGIPVPVDWVAREMTPEMIDAAGLVLTATREHRAAVATMLPRSVRRTFTIREFALIAPRLTPAGWPTAPQARLAALTEQAGAMRGSVVSGAALDPKELDIPDPIGRGQGSFDSTLVLLRAALAPLATLMAPPPTRTAVSG